MGVKTLSCAIAVLLLILQCVQLINAQQNYVAAVADYTPTRNPSNSPETNVIFNAEQYTRLTEQARNRSAQIIVFPEYGLTTVDLPENLFNISAPISVGANPCNNSANNTKFLEILSCAARQHSIYTVVNLVERDIDPNDVNTTLYYNTNVVFNRNGTIHARYRKINLFNEPRITAGNELVTFTTDFGVTFGTFICWDILFKTPALELLELGNVTDIIYSHAWFSETPFLQSLSLQDGYSRVGGVNLLSSSLSNSTAGNGGAGIFTINVASNALSIQTASGQNIVSNQVPRLTTRNPEFACQDGPVIIEPRIGGTVPGISSFNTYTEDITLYTFQALERDITTIDGRVCSEGSQFCCTYSIRTNQPLTENSTVYKVGAFDGVRTVGVTTIGVRTCALMACLNENDETCGTRTPNGTTNVVFNFVDIVVSSEENDETYYQPSTLTYDLLPVSNYTFCNLRNGENTNVVRATLHQPQQSLFSFGVLGRVYDFDGMPSGRSGAHALQLSLSLLTVLLAFVYIH